MNARVLAHLIINFAIGLNRPVSNLMLQKLMYFCQLSYYRHENRRLITDCDFEAWLFGPVIRDVYIDYCMYGSNRIISAPEEDAVLPDCVRHTLTVWLDRRPWEMVQVSHRDGGAWRTNYIEGQKRIIPDADIRLEALNYVDPI
ncbi:DUF4065 domain-containing protein [Succinatimonas hippei]|uniref:Panacea domain-containing protein n=1 Tax=Succinatimonas hippei TaxID=626938 RepID=UPI0025A3B980|nr:type II toxin-antitoxin system antitoxin SocA domain-containing protein [Succinatimonas hippei]MDM8120718.1 DUF4065 domain-containing protein [Succinatimonas hippei]